MALGTHRYMSEQEMRDKVGNAVFDRIRVLNHEWRTFEALVDLGTSRQGTPLQVNRLVAEADVVIGIGAIVPHHIPGFSGSSKIIQPGVCGAETTAETHLLSCRSGGDSFLGIEDNPVRRDMDDMADMVGMNTIFNVVMDSQGGVVGLFFGEKRAAFREGVALAREIYGVPFHETPDIVLSNSYPCDLDFWQSHKSLYACPGRGEPRAHRPPRLHLMVLRGNQGGIPRRPDQERGCRGPCRRLGHGKGKGGGDHVLTGHSGRGQETVGLYPRGQRREGPGRGLQAPGGSGKGYGFDPRARHAANTRRRVSCRQ